MITSSTGLLFVYKDANMYNCDLKSLDDYNWITDNIITYVIKKLLSPSLIILLDPAYISYLNYSCEDDDDYDGARKGLELSIESKYMISIIGNNESLFNHGSHWSLIFVIIDNASKNHKYYHLDSNNNMNHNIAIKTSKKVNILLNNNDNNVNVKSIKVPQQQNGYDCGIYALLYMEHLVSKINSIPNSITDIESYLFDGIFDIISSNDYRNALRSEINEIAKSKL